MPRVHDIPAPLRHEVRRRRLTARLGAALDARVTLVSGPVGSGKTNGVAQWARSIAPDVTWLSLDERDDEPNRFRKRLLERWDRDEHVGVRTGEPATDGWVRDLGELGADKVLVCDGIEAVSDPIALSDIDELCLHGAQQFHVVLVGRVLPPLPSLTRLRLEGELNEIADADLVCHDDEADDVLHALGCNPEPGDLQALLERTEGLMAAVALAGVLVRQRRTTFAVVGGATSEMAQYLYAEVVNELTVDIFGFMLATSVFEHIDPDACNEITGRTDSASVLADLARRNILTTAIDGGERYRYHRLLWEFLRSELRRTRPDRWNALHRAAATYYEGIASEDLALRHWVEANEIEAAWSRFRSRALPRFFDGAVDAVAEWTDLLPPPDREVDAGQALDMALMRLYMGDVDGAEGWFRPIDAHIASHPGDDNAIGCRAYLQFLVDYAHGDLLKAARQGRVARDSLEQSAWSWDELRAPVAHAQLQCLIGLPGRARATLERFVARVNPSEATDRVSTPGVYAEIALAEGRLGEAMAYANASLEASSEVADPELWWTIPALYVRGCVHLERNQLEDARSYLERVLALAARDGFVHTSLLPLIALARVRHITGEQGVALDLLEQGRRMLREHDAISLRQRIDETEALLAITDHDFDRALELVARLHEPHRSKVRARLHTELGEFAEAASSFDRVPEVSTRDRIELLLLRARALDEGQSATLVHDALELGEVDGHVRVFVDEARWLLTVVPRLVGTWPTSYAAEVAAAIVAEPDHPAASRNVAALSEREQEVWRYLSTALSMHEIADALYVSRNTLKSHVRSIYRKLGVSTRDAAVGRDHAHHTEVP